MGIKSFMTDDHRACDTLFATLEAEVDNGSFDAANNAFNPFIDAMLKHFAMEEKVMFPELERILGTSEGPTNVMRMEHTQMRRLMFEMESALQEKNSDRFLGLGETFMILVQQHNMKEEQILYNMAENFLSAQAETLITQMQNTEV